MFKLAVFHSIGTLRWWNLRRKDDLLPFSDTATEPTTTRSTFTFASRPTGTLKSLTPWRRSAEPRNWSQAKSLGFMNHKKMCSIRVQTWEEEHTRSCSLLAPWGGVILLKRPVRSRGVGTSKVFWACRGNPRIIQQTSAVIQHDCRLIKDWKKFSEWW